MDQVQTLEPFVFHLDATLLSTVYPESSDLQSRSGDRCAEVGQHCFQSAKRSTFPVHADRTEYAVFDGNGGLASTGVIKIVSGSDDNGWVATD